MRGNFEAGLVTAHHDRIGVDKWPVESSVMPIAVGIQCLLYTLAVTLGKFEADEKIEPEVFVRSRVKGLKVCERLIKSLGFRYWAWAYLVAFGPD